MLSWYLSALRTHTTQGNIPALDGLRGCAVLLVLASHTQLLFFHGQGAIGVFIFFALSGFLLATPFVRVGNALTLQGFGAYLIRRTMRLLPLYLVLLVTLVAAGMRDTSWFLRHLFFADAEFHLWSIRQELLFYLALPFVVIALTTMRTSPWRAVILVGAIAAAVQELLIVMWNHTHWPGTDEPLYPAIFIFGMLAAFVKERRTSAVPAWVGGVILLLLAVASRSVIDLLLSAVSAEPWGISPGWRLPTVFGFLAALIVSAASCSRGVLGAMLCAPPLQRIGQYGYGIYLWHWYIRDQVSAAGVPFGAAQWAITLLITTALSAVTYYAIEVPGITLGKELSRRLQTRTQHSHPLSAKRV